MTDNATLQAARRLAGRSRTAGFALLAAASLFVLFVSLVPINVEVEASTNAGRKQLQPLPVPGKDLQPLLVKMAGRRLIKPSQVQAAVKDSGAAQKLVKKLKLQGVVQMGDDLVAYVLIDKQQVKAVREGQSVLDFVVDRIRPGQVTLTLDGVEVRLEH